MKQYEVPVLRTKADWDRVHAQVEAYYSVFDKYGEKRPLQRLSASCTATGHHKQCSGRRALSGKAGGRSDGAPCECRCHEQQQNTRKVA